MTSLLWISRSTLVLLIIFASSQVALWAKLNEVNGQLARVGSQLAQLAYVR